MFILFEILMTGFPFLYLNLVGYLNKFSFSFALEYKIGMQLFDIAANSSYYYKYQ